MKKLISILAAALMVAACSSDRDHILKVYNWSDYIDESLIGEFEQWYEEQTGEPVKIGCPCFVDFGKNMEHSPDGKAYLVVQGSSDGKNRRYAYNSWINSDQTYLIRVTPSIANMNDASKYEFFAGYGADAFCAAARRTS